MFGTTWPLAKQDSTTRESRQPGDAPSAAGVGGDLAAELASCLPTPVRRLGEVETSRTQIWLKDDGLTGITYGGNKLRKLGPLLAEAKRRRKRRIVTLGAAGSHHVLATTLYARREGIDVAAVLFPQHGTSHVQDNLRAIVGLGAELLPVGKASQGLAAARALLRSGDFWIGPGAMGNLGANGFADAVQELSQQHRSGELPLPNAIVLPVGSGSSIAGLLVGIVEQELPIRAIGVSVSHNPAVRPMVLGQALTLARWRARAQGRSLMKRRTARLLNQRLSIDSRFAAEGYGRGSLDTRTAIERGLSCGLKLDHTYTAKAFASALAHAEAGVFRHLLFWNTLSALPMTPLLADAPEVVDLPAPVRGLLLPSLDEHSPSTDDLK